MPLIYGNTLIGLIELMTLNNVGGNYMSLESYQKAIAIVEKNKSKCYFAGERSEAVIGLAEETLGLKFTGVYRDFLRNYGAGNFGAQEIYGVINDDFYNSSVPDGIWYTLTERNEIGLPNNLLVIYDTGGDELYCLDFNMLNNAKEPAVISIVPGVDLDKQKFEIIANDFGDFLLDMVTPMDQPPWSTENNS